MNCRHLVALSLLVVLASCSRYVSRRWAGSDAAVPQTAVAGAMRTQVRNAVQAGDGDWRVAELRRRMTLEPGNLALRLELASYYERAGYPELAAEHYRLASERFPDASSAFLGLAKALRAQGLSKEAAEVLTRFLETHPDSASIVYSWAGIVSDEAGLLIEGEEFHRQAIYRSREPQAALFNNLGQNLLLQNRPADAAPEFRKALKIHPRSEIARNNLAIALASDPREAIVHMRSVTDPATAYSNLAAVLIEQGRYQDARAALGSALQFMPGNQAALRNLALLAQLDGGPASAALKHGKSKDELRLSQERKRK